jgi:SAGA-associated factor 29
VSTLSGIYDNPATVETIGRINRLISAWPTDDTLPAEGIGGVKTVYKKLSSGLREIHNTTDRELKSDLPLLGIVLLLIMMHRAIDEALDNIGLLIALKNSTEGFPSGKSFFGTIYTYLLTGFQTRDRSGRGDPRRRPP